MNNTTKTLTLELGIDVRRGDEQEARIALLNVDTDAVLYFMTMGIKRMHMDDIRTVAHGLQMAQWKAGHECVIKWYGCAR